MSMLWTEHSATGHWSAGYDEAGLRAWAAELRGRLDAPQVSLGLVFMAPRLFPWAAEILEVLRVHGQIGLLAGCSGSKLVAGSEEIEDEPGLVVGLYHLPGAQLRGVRLTSGQMDEAHGGAYWRAETGLSREAVGGWLAFLDPHSLDGERWLGGWNEAYPRTPTLGGLASGEPEGQRTQVYLDGEVFEEGGVVVAVGGEVELRGAVAQGCVPIGEAWTVTRAEGNLIHQIGNRPAYAVLADTFNALTREEQRRAQGNLFLGLVTDEYKEVFGRGDFLVRNLLGGDPTSGVLAVGARPRMGQSVQFQCRDALAATEDMVGVFRRVRAGLGGRRIYGGCLCSCLGRGARLFRVRHHDAGLAQRFFGPLGLTGFFCNGEIGPVGEENYIHGYTASLALFVARAG